MATPQFKNMNELADYLSTLETRVQKLEAENQTLRAIQPKNIVQSIPKTNLISPSFFKRALAVWGHFMVINLIIGAIIGSAYFCLVVLLLNSFLGSVSSGQ